MRFQDKKSLLLACFVLLVLYVVATTEADAQSNQLVLEKEKNWETYRSEMELQVARSRRWNWIFGGAAAVSTLFAIIVAVYK